MKTKLAATGGAAPQTYVDSVFSTWLYTGNGSTQTINNGIDLAGKGGLVWFKPRNTGNNHNFIDSQQGINKFLISNDINAAQTANAGYGVTSFNSDGFSLGNPWSSSTNTLSTTYASWTFRKAAKFFDVVTYTGNGTVKTVNHSLGSAPGFMIVKCTSAVENWAVYHRTLGATQYIELNNTNAASVSVGSRWDAEPTSTSFSVGYNGSVNTSGATYVAYLFAHDTSSTGIIQCGSFTSAPGIESVTLGWEPQWLLYKRADPTAGGWTIVDSMRGVPTGSASVSLSPNTSAAETAGPNITFSATGFSMDVGSTGDVWIYMAIRRPNKPPTSGTQVYLPKTRTGTGAAATVTGVGFAPDMLISENKSSPEGWMANRLAGFSNTAASYLFTPYSSAETAVTSATSGVMLDGATTGTVSLTAGANLNSSGQLYVDWFFKRAPGFMDVVCYTGTDGNVGVVRSIPHNLGVAPELVILRKRSQAANWVVWCNFFASTNQVWLNSTNAIMNDSMAGVGDNGYIAADSSPSSNFKVIGGAASGYNVNTTGATYVAYLFATLAGISKVGSYTGNGTSQNINCGFAAGARFFLVKATSTTGSWWIWDSARGITAGNDPALQLNSTAAEITTANAVDPYSPGIIVNQEATCSINASGVSYVYLAIS